MSNNMSYNNTQQTQSNITFQAQNPMPIQGQQPVQMVSPAQFNYTHNLNAINLNLVGQTNNVADLFNVPGFTPMLYDPITGFYSHIVHPASMSFDSSAQFNMNTNNLLLNASYSNSLCWDSGTSSGEISSYEKNSMGSSESNSDRISMDTHEYLNMSGFEGSSGEQKKYPYRSKQRKIEKVRGAIEERFTNLGLFAAEKELVRGVDTVRVHVKTFPGLTQITIALAEIENHPEIQITRIACPFSKKNKKQKKGFIVYLKLASANQAAMVQNLMKKYEPALKNCVIALPREMKMQQNQSTLPNVKEESLAFSMTPAAMIKRSSGA